MQYVSDFLRSAWKNKKYVAAIPLASFAGWGAAVGIDAISDNSTVEYVSSLVPQVAAASTGGLASVKIRESQKGRKLNAGEKAVAFTLGALTCAGLYKGFENLNSIPAVNEYLSDISESLGEDFPSKHRIYDIGTAIGISLAGKYAFEGIKNAKKIFKRGR